METNDGRRAAAEGGAFANVMIMRNITRDNGETS
jgi:hypothetical protein